MCTVEDGASDTRREAVGQALGAVLPFITEEGESLEFILLSRPCWY